MILVEIAWKPSRKKRWDLNTVLSGYEKKKYRPVCGLAVKAPLRMSASHIGVLRCKFLPCVLSPAS